MNLNHFKNFILVLCMIIGSTWFLPATLNGAKPDITRFWLNPGKPQTVKLYGKDGINAPYYIYNFQGKLIKQGKVNFKKGVASLELTLQEGYYRLKFQNRKLHYGLMAIAPFRGKEDSFFAMDSAMSWLAAGTKKAYREGLVKILKRCGIGAIRERIWWGDINPAASKWNWNPAGRQYESLRKLCLNNGIKILDLYHDAPVWTGAGNRYKGQNPYPVDLIAVKKSWIQIQKRWAKYWDSWEIWNEPDIGFGGNLPADQYLPLVKSISFAVKQSNWKGYLAGGVFAADYPTKFHESCGKNGLLENINCISYHSYNSAFSLESSIAAYRKWMRKYRHEKLPIWLTESGFSWSTGKNGSMLEKELKLSAMNVVMKTAEAKACGVERYYPFVYSSYAEGAASFSVFRKNFSVFPSLGGYAFAVKVLSGKNYIGDLKHFNKNIKRARIFSNTKDEAVIVMFSGKVGGNQQFKLPFKFRPFDLDGSSLKVSPGGVASINSGVVYVFADHKDLIGKIETDTLAMQLKNIAGNNSDHDISKSSGIVILPQPDIKRMYKHTAAGYYVTPEQATRIPLTVKLFNLNQAKKDFQFSIKAISPDGKLLQQIKTEKITLKKESTETSKLNLDIKRNLLDCRNVIVEITAGNHDKAYMNYILQEAVKAKVMPIGMISPVYDFGKKNNWLSMSSLWYGPKDLGAEFSANWTAQKLVLTVNVCDNHHSQDYAPEKLWRGDSVQFAIQKLKDNRLPIPGRTTQFSIGLNNGKVSIYADRIIPKKDRKEVEKSIKVSILKESDHIKYVIIITPKTLDLKSFTAGQELGFSLLVNDNDSYGRKGCICWGDGIAKYNGNSLTYNKLKLLNQ